MPIGDWYSLESMKVDPRQLFLDPKNPRLRSKLDGRRDLSDIATQSVLKSILLSEMGALELAEDFLSNGFLNGTQPILVERRNDGKLIVIEGNRRAAALRHLLETRPDDSVPESIKSIPVQLLSIANDAPVSDKSIRRTVLSHIHVQGQRPWGSYEKACMVYDQYIEAAGNPEPFRYSVPAGKVVAAQLGFATQQTRKLVKIKRVFEQCIEAKIAIENNHYTLVEMAVNTHKVKDYFGVDNDSCEMSEVGLRRFETLCIEKQSNGKAIIHNDALFRRFSGVWANANSPSLVKAVEAGSMSIEEAHEFSRDVLTDKGRQQLEKVFTILSRLNTSDFLGTWKERDSWERVKNQISKIDAYLESLNDGR